MAVYRNFRSDPLDRLNYNNEQFKLRLDEIAFTSPSTYFRIKKRFLEVLVRDTLTGLHENIFYALTVGTRGDRGAPIFAAGDFPAAAVELARGGDIVPNVSAEHADQIALNVAKTIKEIFEKEIIDTIFATDNIKQALDRASRNAELNQV